MATPLTKLILVPGFILAAGCAGRPAGVPTQSSLWITAYYAAWQEATMPPREVDMSSLTHLVYFSLMPTAKGGLDPAPNGFKDDTAYSFAAAAHKAGKKVLVCIGGAGSGPAFRQAYGSTTRGDFIRNITSWVMQHQYDGIDIDMEPVEPSDKGPYQQFIGDLRKAMTAKKPSLLLTAAVGQEPAPFVGLAAAFDQINVMTYDLAGPWEGWETWHNSPLYNGGRKFKSNGQPMPSVAELLQKWVAAGFPKAKLGLGIDFYGVQWHGASGPNQPITGVKTQQISYAQVRDTLFKPDHYHWDTGPHAPYLFAAGSFVSFDDERSCAEKIAYARSTGLGGAIIWELGGDYRPGQPSGQRHPLLSAIRQAVSKP